MKYFFRLLMPLFFAVMWANAQDVEKGALIYHNQWSGLKDVADWKMEGPGAVDTGVLADHSAIRLYSPGQKGHIVWWCPVDFPSNFIAEWKVQNLHVESGLCIVFFAATDLQGGSILNHSLPKRNGKFSDYTKGQINNYHISYYANAKGEKGRAVAHLRKNRGFHKVQTGQEGIPVLSTAVHTVRLVKHEGRICFYVDDRKVIDWKDDGRQYGSALQQGKIGIRQMKWTNFAYSDFKVWETIALPQ